MKRIVLVALALFNTIYSQAQKGEIFSKSSQAIRGYDPVAYFTEGKPVKGSEAFTLNWKDANWFFSSKENLELFKKSPEKYAPQYGGYCAYGCSNGYKASTEPDAWTIVNGKLYLNYNTRVRSEWEKNRDERIQKGDKNWPEIKDKG
jgi:YHS domain-containing protein